MTAVPSTSHLDSVGDCATALGKSTDKELPLFITGDCDDPTSNAVLVTGAAGFIGSHIVTGLADRGIAVIGVDTRDAPAHLQKAMTFYRMDFVADPILAMVRGGRFDAVVHQAAISSTLEDDWRLLRNVNVDRAMILAEACAVERTPFIYASSSSVYGRIYHQDAVAEDAVNDRAVCSGPINAYARSKLLLDTLLATRDLGGLRCIGLRYTNVFGSGEQHKGSMASIISRLLRKVAANGEPTLFADTLDASRDYAPVHWVVQVILRLLEAPVPAGIYNVGSSCPISFKTLLQWCAEFSHNEKLQFHLIPNPIPARYQYWTCADVQKLQRTTGLTPPTMEDVRAAALTLYHEAARNPLP